MIYLVKSSWDVWHRLAPKVPNPLIRPFVRSSVRLFIFAFHTYDMDPLAIALSFFSQLARFSVPRNGFSLPFLCSEAQLNSAAI